MKPKRANPAPMHSTPAITAIAAAAAARASGSCPATLTTAARIKGDSDESGPSTRIREGPSTAYARSGTIDAYKP